MARPLTEFIQSQLLSWESSPHTRAGTDAKLLSIDEAGTERTILIRYPAGHSSKSTLEGDEEFIVLKGEIAVNQRRYKQHYYGFLPLQGGPLEVTSESGAVVLTFVSAPGRAACAALEAVDTTALPWDRSNIDPKVDHLYTARKNLRFAPDGNCRTYLLAGYPQGFPPSGLSHLERHPHVEEFFLIYGDMSCSFGVMRAGAYCWRPPMVWHGLDCSRSGFLIMFRSPGANRNSNEWDPNTSTVEWDPQHRPALPSNLKDAFPEPFPDPIQY